MSEERKKPGVGFWSASVLLVLLAYPASFGPACWISSRAERGGAILGVIYRPILKLMSLEKLSQLRPLPHDDGNPWGGVTWGHKLERGMFVWYAEVGAEEGAHWHYDVRYHQDPGESVVITKEEWRWPQ